jgi:hypothetical protein
MAAAKGYDMTDGKFWGYVLGGAAIGGESGYAGANIAGAGGFMSQTMGMVYGSTAGSLGMTMLSGMATKPTINFGVASFGMGNMELNYLGKKGNSLLQNFGYLSGALANVQDIMAGVNGISIEVKARK